MKIGVSGAGGDGVDKVPGRRPLIRDGDRAQVDVAPAAEEVDELLQSGERDAGALDPGRPKPAARLARNLGQVVGRDVPLLVLQAGGSKGDGRSALDEAVQFPAVGRRTSSGLSTGW